MARYELEDAQWDLIKNLFPKQKRGGKWNDHRMTLNGMLWVLRSGAPWRDIPERYGKWKSIHGRFNRYRRDGTFDRILKALQIRLDKQGKIDWNLWLVDGSNVRASRVAAGARKRGKGTEHEPADHALGRSRGGWGSKFHLVTDGKGLPLAVTLTAGQAHESTQLLQLIHHVHRPGRMGWPRQLAGDKGYSYEHLRENLHGCGIEPVIPRKSNQTRPKGERFDRKTYRKRSRIECSVGSLKECRRIGTRYEKLAINFLAFMKLAFMLKYLRVLDP